MAGSYALAGTCLVMKIVQFHPAGITDNSQAGDLSSPLWRAILLAIIVLILSIGTAVLLSYHKARNKGEKLWNTTAKRLLGSMAVPLVAGGLLVFILIDKGMIGLVAPFTLLFYGLAVCNASKFTYADVKFLGITQVALGLFSAYFVEYAIWCWGLGFGVAHIVYGIYMHYKYEK